MMELQRQLLENEEDVGISTGSDHGVGMPCRECTALGGDMGDVSLKALEAAAMHVFESYWPGARAERIRRWREARFRMLLAWPAKLVWQTMLRAWCELTFGGGVRRAIAPSPDRKRDELCVKIGSVPWWRG